MLYKIPNLFMEFFLSDYARSSIVKSTIEETSSCKLTISEFLEARLESQAAGLLAWACGASVASPCDAITPTSPSSSAARSCSKDVWDVLPHIQETMWCPCTMIFFRRLVCKAARLGIQGKELGRTVAAGNFKDFDSEFSLAFGACGSREANSDARFQHKVFSQLPLLQRIRY